MKNSVLLALGFLAAGILPAHAGYTVNGRLAGLRDGPIKMHAIFDAAVLAETVAKRKVEIIMRHYATQATKSWFRAETFEAAMRLRAIECNSPTGWAEAFHGRKIVLSSPDARSRHRSPR